MTHKSYKAESRIDWGTNMEGGLTLEQINTGAILRIADATEKMAQRHTELIRRNEYLESYVKLLDATKQTKDRQINALRGHINRMKKAMK